VENFLEFNPKINIGDQFKSQEGNKRKYLLTLNLLSALIGIIVYMMISCVIDYMMISCVIDYMMISCYCLNDDQLCCCLNDDGHLSPFLS